MLECSSSRSGGLKDSVHVWNELWSWIVEERVVDSATGWWQHDVRVARELGYLAASRCWFPEKEKSVKNDDKSSCGKSIWRVLYRCSFF